MTRASRDREKVEDPLKSHEEKWDSYPDSFEDHPVEIVEKEVPRRSVKPVQKSLAGVREKTAEEDGQ